MDTNSNEKNTPTHEEHALFESFKRDETSQGLEALFTPIQSNTPVEQFVRRC